MTSERVTTFERDGLHFDVSDAGPVDGEPVVLLHGWPGGAATWDEVSPRLAERGLRTLAPNQRGYSPGARPANTRRYAMVELTADVLALLDTAGLDRVHLVGHDWGGIVAWALATEAPDRLASLTVLSTPHPSAMQRAMLTSTQAFTSWYMLAFQVPHLPERFLLADGGRRLREALIDIGLGAERAAAYAKAQSEPGALTASLAWYRALRFARPSKGPGPIEVPTTFAWGTADAALGRAAAELTERYVAGPYRLDVLPDASHWLPEENADRVVELISDAVAAHPVAN